MRVGIIAAMDQEMALLKQHLFNYQTETIGGMEFLQGTLNGVDVVLLKSGIGKVNAAVGATLMIDRYHVDYVLNTGSAGAVDPGLKVGDVVIAHSLTYHDVDVTAFGYEPGQMAGMPELYYPDTGLLRTLQAAARQTGIEPVVGQIVSADEFVSHPDRIEAIRDTFKTARACEMESTAIAQVCHVLETPFAIVRSISDTADMDAAIDFDEFIVIAGNKSAKMVMALLTLLKAENK